MCEVEKHKCFTLNLKKSPSTIFLPISACNDGDEQAIDQYIQWSRLPVAVNFHGKSTIEKSFVIIHFLQCHLAFLKTFYGHFYSWPRTIPIIWYKKNYTKDKEIKPVLGCFLLQLSAHSTARQDYFYYC